MTRKTSNLLWCVLLVFVLILSACSSAPATSTSNNAANNAEATAATDAGTTEAATETTEPAAGETAAADTAATELPSKDITGEVTVWAFNEQVFDEIGTAFMAEYPGIKLKTVVMPFGDLHDKLQTTIAAGSGAPDVAEVEMYQLNRYMAGHVLENLLEEPYNAGKYKDLVHPFNWERWMTPDSSELLGMPWDMTPGVYYYRADIFEELGLPSDPAELGEYIQDEENFLNLVQILKANGKYFMEWNDGPAVWAGDEVGYFDKDMNWTRNTEKMVKVLDITKRGQQLGWAPHIGYASDEGKQLVLKGDLVGVVAGSFGARGLQETFPELAGKWRATRLPVGINVGMGGSSFVIPAQSKNKEAAWAYIQWSMRSENAWKIWTKHSIQPGYKDISSLDWYANTKNEYLGGQEEFKLYEQLSNDIPIKHLTPVDNKGWEIFIAAIGDALAKNTDSKTVIQKIGDDVMAQASKEIAAFKKAMQE
ncbi:extracellular solute-binding protein [Paenibacillus sp. MMS20-IR301]|uniref:ABC transporter substrate-binding protein n=1 Tax=Paenibacillus sp. MMS20-IR301 TaxID=2895946 RepID=UPI0028E620B5|nr:extracellular solute-binding protein [Paenibacillus sp. MMS20-IR301]WNS43427.1 extracellular solute-binding protein [Paenibacillus sp. MMS20-IR301]